MVSKRPQMQLPRGAMPAAGFRLLSPERVEELNELARLVRELDLEDAEQRRYGAAAARPEACLCTPVDYALDASHIPARILEVDYGCGDPTPHARSGEVVLDLGSGSGKHCFLMARAVGAEGCVIGVDKTPAMLALARGAVSEVTHALGYPRDNLSFRRGHIENLRWDLDRLEDELRRQPVNGYEDLATLADRLDRTPLVATASVDLVVSNCVLNLVADARKPSLFRELYRVLRPGGRAVIADIVAERPVPPALKQDEELWTGCVAGALPRAAFLQAFAAAGFHGVEELHAFHWRTVEGIAFHSVTVRAFKGKEGPCHETYRSALYRGPFSTVQDDDGHTFVRGQAVAVCEKTARLLTREPYAGHFWVSDALVDPAHELPFDCISGRRGELPPDVAAQAQRRPGLVSPASSGASAAAGSCDPRAGCC